MSESNELTAKSAKNRRAERLFLRNQKRRLNKLKNKIKENESEQDQDS